MKRQLTVGIYLSILNFAKTADQGLIISSVNDLSLSLLFTWSQLIWCIMNLMGEVAKEMCEVGLNLLCYWSAAQDSIRGGKMWKWMSLKLWISIIYNSSILFQVRLSVHYLYSPWPGEWVIMNICRWFTCLWIISQFFFGQFSHGCGLYLDLNKLKWWRDGSSTRNNGEFLKYCDGMVVE